MNPDTILMLTLGALFAAMLLAVRFIVRSMLKRGDEAVRRYK